MSTKLALLGRLALTAALVTLMTSNWLALRAEQGNSADAEQRLLNKSSAKPLVESSVKVYASRSDFSNLNVARAGHTATLLKNGKVLVVGGGNNSIGSLASSELYDPLSGTWSLTGSLAARRASHTATLLQNGKVIVAGGAGSDYLASAELYDPAVGTWSNTGNLSTKRFNHTATLLANGKVLVAGGLPDSNTFLASSELYDPMSGMWSNTANLTIARSGHTATLLPNGKVLVAGGNGRSGGILSSLTSAELYDPVSGMWSFTGNLSAARSGHTAILLLNGRVVVAGGINTKPELLSSVDLYDPVSGTWGLTGSLSAARYHHTMTLLPNGKVIVAGGSSISGEILASAELYDQAMGTWGLAGILSVARSQHTATLLPSGKFLIAGGFGFGGTLNNSESFDNATVNPFPTPSVTMLSPDSINNRKGAFNLLVLGSNFVKESVVRWNGNNRPTVFASSTQLTASISASDTSNAGTAIVTVINPAPGGGTSNAVLLPITNILSNVSAATYRLCGCPAESIVTAFGTDLASRAQSATTVPLPTSLAGTTVVIKDFAGSERPAPLFFVSPTQVNYQIPPGTVRGNANVMITSGTGLFATGLIDVRAITPGLFSANSSGQGVAAGLILRARANNTQSYEPIARFDNVQGKYVAVPIDMGQPTDQVFLILFGTGMRFYRALSAVSAAIGGTNTDVLFVGKQGGLVGVDQVNLRLSRTLIGRGEVDTQLIFIDEERYLTNTVRITFR